MLGEGAAAGKEDVSLELCLVNSGGGEPAADFGAGVSQDAKKNTFHTQDGGRSSAGSFVERGDAFRPLQDRQHIRGRTERIVVGFAVFRSSQPLPNFFVAITAIRLI